MAGLRKAALMAYRASWVILFAAAVASLVYFNPRRQAEMIRLGEAGHALGFVVYSNQGVAGLLGAAYGDEGRRLGFREDDLVTTVDGRPVPADTAGRVALLAGSPGSRATLGIRRADGTRVTIVAPRDPGIEARAHAGSGITFAAQRWLTFAVATMGMAASLVAALLLFLRRPRDPVAQLLSASLVTIHSGIATLIPGSPFVLGLAVTLIAQIGLWLAILLFPDGRFSTRWHIPALVVLIASSTADVAELATSTSSLWTVVLNQLQSLVTLVAVVRQLQLTPPGIRRQQSKFVLFGVAAYCTLYIIALCLLPLEALPIAASTVGWITFAKWLFFQAAAVAIPAGLLVSLLRYRLYDAETAISRSVAFGALTVALIAVFAGSEKVIEILGEGYVGERLGGLSSAIAAAVAAATISPLHHRVTRWAERRFQGNLVHLRQGLPLLVGDLRETATPAALADAMLDRLERGVRASHGAVVAGGSVVAARDIGVDAVGGWLAVRGEAVAATGRLECERADPVFPMRVPLRADGAGHVGWLLLGPRPDGSFYGKDERETLASIADPAARALAIAVARETREGEQRRREAATRRTLDALSRFVRERFGVDVRGDAGAPSPGADATVPGGSVAGAAAG